MSGLPGDNRPRNRWPPVLAGAVVGVVVSLAIFSEGGEGVFTHVTCAPSGATLPPFHAWIPTVMANSPYGGMVWANGTVPSGPFRNSPAAPYLYGIYPRDGSAAWAGFGAEFNVTSQGNQTRLGPGSNTPCSAPYQIAPTFWGDISLGISLLGEGNTTDANEPTSLGGYIPPSTAELGILNGFSLANHDPVSTCGSGAASRWTNSTSFVATVPIASGASLANESYTFPFFDSFHYWFPANSGTWQVDNLSAPGGPGGGWAFSYSPCF